MAWWQLYGGSLRFELTVARFLDIGIKSAMELENQLKLAKDYGILRTLDWKRSAKRRSTFAGCSTVSARR